MAGEPFPAQGKLTPHHGNQMGGRDFIGKAALAAAN